MTRWSAWRSVAAAAVLGFVDAVGSEEVRSRLAAPTPVVRFSRFRTPAPPSRLWFLTPLTGWRRFVNRN